MHTLLRTLLAALSVAACCSFSQTASAAVTKTKLGDLRRTDYVVTDVTGGSGGGISNLEEVVAIVTNYDTKVVAPREKKVVWAAKPRRLGPYLWEMSTEGEDWDAATNRFAQAYPSFRACTGVCSPRYHGRNLDWNYDKGASVVIRSPARDGKHAVLGLSTGVVTDDILSSGNWVEAYHTLPFTLSDGINDQGVVIQQNVLQKDVVRSGTWRVKRPNSVILFAVIRYALDRCATAQEAAQLLKERTFVPSEFAYDVHFLVSDRTSSFIVEDGTVYSANDCPTDVMTNFRNGTASYNADGTVKWETVETYGIGLERYDQVRTNGLDLADFNGLVHTMTNLWYTHAYETNTVPYWYTEHCDPSKPSFTVLNAQDHQEIFTEEKEEWYADYVSEHMPDSQRYRKGMTWQTVHTAIYDKQYLNLRLFVQEDTGSERVFRLTLNKPLTVAEALGDGIASNLTIAVRGVGELKADVNNLYTSNRIMTARADGLDLSVSELKTAVSNINDRLPPIAPYSAYSVFSQYAPSLRITVDNGIGFYVLCTDSVYRDLRETLQPWSAGRIRPQMSFDLQSLYGHVFTKDYLEHTFSTDVVWSSGFTFSAETVSNTVRSVCGGYGYPTCYGRPALIRELVCDLLTRDTSLWYDKSPTEGHYGNLVDFQGVNTAVNAAIGYAKRAHNEIAQLQRDYAEGPTFGTPLREAIVSGSDFGITDESTASINITNGNRAITVYFTMRERDGDHVSARCQAIVYSGYTSTLSLAGPSGYVFRGLSRFLLEEGYYLLTVDRVSYSAAAQQYGCVARVERLDYQTVRPDFTADNATLVSTISASITNHVTSGYICTEEKAGWLAGMAGASAAAQAKAASLPNDYTKLTSNAAFRQGVEAVSPPVDVQGVIDENIRTHNLCTVAAAQAMTNSPFSVGSIVRWKNRSDIGYFLDGPAIDANDVYCSGLAWPVSTILNEHENAIAVLISTKSDKATTLSGYGITDAYTKTQIDGTTVTNLGAVVVATNIAEYVFDTRKTDFIHYDPDVNSNRTALTLGTRATVAGTPAWSASATYQQGDTIVHDGVVYVCIVSPREVVSPSPWGTQYTMWKPITVGSYSMSVGVTNIASGVSSRAEGSFANAEGQYAHAEGLYVRTDGIASHAEGQATRASGLFTHAEGLSAMASGMATHAEGNNTTASGVATLAAGVGSTASGYATHAEGHRTVADGLGSHAEGSYTRAGSTTVDPGDGTSVVYRAAAHAEGWGAVATNQTAFVWQGLDGSRDAFTAPTVQETYHDHGAGTFNVNPVGGLGGFYIGSQALSSLIPQVENSLTSTDTSKALSANMGRELKEALDNMSARGRYLSLWNCTNGVPYTNPTVSPYDYRTGDYYIVGVVDSLTNYSPSGASYVIGTASTNRETGVVQVNDTYYYDGTSWTLVHAEQREVSFASLAGVPDDNAALKAALDEKMSFEYTDNYGFSTVTARGTVPYWEILFGGTQRNRIEFSADGQRTYIHIEGKDTTDGKSYYVSIDPWGFERRVAGTVNPKVLFDALVRTNDMATMSNMTDYPPSEKNVKQYLLANYANNYTLQQTYLTKTDAQTTYFLASDISQYIKKSVVETNYELKTNAATVAANNLTTAKTYAKNYADTLIRDGVENLAGQFHNCRITGDGRIQTRTWVSSTWEDPEHPTLTVTRGVTEGHWTLYDSQYGETFSLDWNPAYGRFDLSQDSTILETWDYGGENCGRMSLIIYNLRRTGQDMWTTIGNVAKQEDTVSKSTKISGISLSNDVEIEDIPLKALKLVDDDTGTKYLLKVKSGALKLYSISE